METIKTIETDDRSEILQALARFIVLNERIVTDLQMFADHQNPRGFIVTLHQISLPIDTSEARSRWHSVCAIAGRRTEYENMGLISSSGRGEGIAGRDKAIGTRATRWLGGGSGHQS